MEGLFIASEFGERVEGAAPGDSSLPERDEHGAQQAVDEEDRADGKEHGVPGRDAAESSGETIERGDGDQGDARRGCGSWAMPEMQWGRGRSRASHAQAISRNEMWNWKTAKRFFVMTLTTPMLPAPSGL